MIEETLLRVTPFLWFYLITQFLILVCVITIAVSILIAYNKSKIPLPSYGIIYLLSICLFLFAINGISKGVYIFIGGSLIYMIISQTLATFAICLFTLLLPKEIVTFWIKEYRISEIVKQYEKDSKNACTGRTR